MASMKWELRAYWKEVSIINDKQLNVTGKYALNQALSETPVFGNPLQTVSTAMYLAKLHKFGKWWEKKINKWDKNHFQKSYESHKRTIRREFENILNQDISRN